ncbi:MAG: helix-turn-helix domain-containing protein [Anaerolineae bacterium]|nr:helix-turn-helix domain-containing protein [Anaerolineae bacterium]
MKVLDNNNLLDMDEAASLLNIRKSTLYSMCMRREIPVVKLGRLNRFRRQDLVRWVESHIQGQN